MKQIITEKFNNTYIITISFISALGGYLFGSDFAIISGTLPFLRNELGLNAVWQGVLTGSLVPVTWVLISEIFPDKLRGLASSVAMVSFWSSYFILVFSFPILAGKMGTYGPFHLCAGICFLGFLFIKRNVRETKVKTLEELEANLIIY